MLAAALFWVFQILNGYSALGLAIAPRKVHEALFPEPARVYKALGFSTVACEMLHNVLRGQGAALLAITLFLFHLGPGDRSSFLLIALTCLLTCGAHVMTYRHHKGDKLARDTLGDAVNAIKPMIGVNLVVGGSALAVFFFS